MKKNFNKKSVWILIALVMVCCLGIWLLQDATLEREKPNGVSLVKPTVTTVITVETATKIPPTATITDLPTAAPTIIFDCIPINNKVETGVVTTIIDGDTIYVIIDGQEYSVRYVGINAPEMDSGDPLAEQARLKNAELVDGKTVTLVRDVSETDVFGRLLRYVLVGDIFVNYELVREGLAIPKEYPPDTACHQTLESALGKTRSIPLELNPTGAAQTTPACPNGCTSEQPACAIKGNISMSGDKIYHMPGMRDYEKTVISPDYDERWFCTEEEAVANGWRRALR